MKLQNLTVIFIIIVLPIILLVSLYISTGLKTIRYQALYDTGLITATQDAIQAFEINTLKNKYSANAEVKRSAIKASVKMLEKGLCNTCNISSYNTAEIEEYIPAVLFGMNNGFYLYTPSYNPTTKKYEHSLKNYVYYSETLNGDTSDTNSVVIIYHLDSYIEVSGWFNGNYESGEGYLINTNKVKFEIKDTSIDEIDTFYAAYKASLAEKDVSNYSINYYGTSIDVADELAVNYFVDNYKFSKWFNDTVYSNVSYDEYKWLEIDEKNDPEDPESDFSKHKKEVIKNKIQNVLNSSITAYSERTYGQNYKMPKLSEEDWEKIYTDISVITFFQGKKIGFTKYNGYCVLNSNNHNELINPNLLYFSTDDNKDEQINTTDDYYHDIRCSKIPTSKEYHKTEKETGITTVRGWKIGRLQRKTITKTDETTGEENDYYTYERNELGCYECINGSVNSGTSVYDYIAVADSTSHKGNTDKSFIKESYWTSLARERAKLHEDKEIPSDITVEKKVKLASEEDDKYKNTTIARNGEKVIYKITITNNAKKTDIIHILDEFECSKIVDIEQISIKSGESSLSGNDFEKLKTEDESEKGIMWSGITIDAEETVEIIYKSKVLGSSEETIKNTVNVYTTSGMSAKAEAQVNIRATDITVEKLIDGKSSKTLKYGDTVTYTVTINNNKEAEKVDIIDEIESGIEIIEIPKIREISGTKSDDGKITWKNVNLPKGPTIITYKAIIKGDIGETLKNTVTVYVPSDESTTIAQASADSKITATIKTKSGSGKDFHVILVLDNSGSMTGKIENVKNAAKKLINSVGEDKVTIISFAQNPKELENINEYSIWGNGLSTNYTGGLYKAIDCMKDPNLDYYVVFMSDGCPTATQNTAIIDVSSNPDKPTILEITQKLILGGWDAVQSILGGWLECIWKSENDYGFRLLLTGSIDWDFDIGVCKTAWNMIRTQLSGVSAKAKKIYTVYFDTSAGGHDDTPKYGLSRMASAESDFYTSNNENGLITNFENIAKSITNQEKEKEYNLERSSIQLEKIDDIKEILIGSKKYSGTQLNNIKNQIERDSDGNGILNVNNITVDGEYIFKTSEDITIIY